MTTYSPPIELRPVCSSDQKSPRIERSPISFGDVSPSTPFDRSMPPEKSSTFSTSSPNQQLSSSLSSDKLISLDTPQQTPTAVNPPLLFDLTAHKNQLSNAINDLDGNGNGQIDKTNSNNNHHSSSTSNGKCLLSVYFSFCWKLETKKNRN